MTVVAVGVAGSEHIGRAALPVDRLQAIGRLALRRNDVELASAEFWPSSYPTSTIATERLTHCRLAFSEGTTARVFVKEIRDVVHWPLLHVVPEQLRPSFLAEFPWRLEIIAYSAGFGCPLPDGLRLPELYAVEELGSGRAALWMEEIEQDPDAVWSTDRFACAAYRLGRLAARRRPPLVQPLCGGGSGRVGPNGSLRMMYGGRIENLFRPAIEGESVWRHPTVATALDRTGDRAVIDDLRRLIALGQRLIDETDALPMT